MGAIACPPDTVRAVLREPVMVLMVVTMVAMSGVAGCAPRVPVSNSYKKPRGTCLLSHETLNQDSYW